MEPKPPPSRTASFGANSGGGGGGGHPPWNPNYGVVGSGDRRLAFSRQLSDARPPTPHPRALARSDSSIAIPQQLLDAPAASAAMSVVRSLASSGGGSRPMRRLALLIGLNVAYSATELAVGLLTGRIGLVSDAFHLTFGCGLLTFSLFAMGASRRKPDDAYTYGYQRLEVLAAFTNALFLLFLSFSLAVEALHAFMQDESEHKHYLIVSAVTNLLVNLLGVWFFRSYARVNIVYRKAEDMNYHSVCLHVLADSIRRLDPSILAFVLRA